MTDIIKYYEINEWLKFSSNKSFKIDAGLM